MLSEYGAVRVAVEQCLTWGMFNIVVNQGRKQTIRSQ
jgi:hypothetical protein